MEGPTWRRLLATSTTFAAVVAVGTGCTLIIGLQVVPAAEDDGGLSAVGSDRFDGSEQERMDASTAILEAGAGDGTVTAALEGAPAAEAAGDAGDGDASALPGAGLHASMILAGTSLKIKGMTRDGWIVYLDTSGSNFDYRAIQVPPSDAGVQSLSGASYQEIARVPYEGSGDALVINDLAFTWGGGTLTLWSSALGAKPVTVSGTSVVDAVWASDDSSHFAYIDSLSGAIYGVNGDGTHPTMLVSSADSRCTPRLTFGGDYLVIGYCPGGTTNAMLQSFDISNGWAPSLQTPESLVSSIVDPEGTMVVAPAPTGGTSAFQVFPLDGGPGRVLDPATPFIYGENNAGALTYPWYVVYNNDAGALKQAYTSLSPPPRVLVDAGVTAFEAVSPSGQWLVTARDLDGTGQPLDLSLASMTDPGTPVSMGTSSDGRIASLVPPVGHGLHGGREVRALLLERLRRPARPGRRSGGHGRHLQRDAGGGASQGPGNPGNERLR